MVLHNLFGLKTLAISGITSPFPMKAVGKFSLKEGAKEEEERPCGLLGPAGYLGANAPVHCVGNWHTGRGHVPVEQLFDLSLL